MAAAESGGTRHVSDRGGIIEVSVKAADGEVYTWHGTGSLELVRTKQQHPVTKVMEETSFITAVLSLDESAEQAKLPVRPAVLKSGQSN